MNAALGNLQYGAATTQNEEMNVHFAADCCSHSPDEVICDDENGSADRLARTNWKESMLPDDCSASLKIVLRSYRKSAKSSFDESFEIHDKSSAHRSIFDVQSVSSLYVSFLQAKQL